MHIMQSRRDFLASLSAAGAAGVLGGGRTSLADEGPLETTSLRLYRDPSICVAPNQIAVDLLRAEGFTDIRYIPDTPVDAVARGELDFDFNPAVWLASHLAAGEQVTVLAGVHSGCFELFAQEPIRTISDLKGKRVGISDLGSGRYLFLRIMAAYVGLDPDTDINWVTSPTVRPADLFEAGKVDAFLSFPPESLELRAREIGRVIVNTTTDKPWSQYFCCLVFGNKEFVRDHPIATKRYLRAILMAADICATEPEQAARRQVDAGFTPRYGYALQTLTELPYDRWREFDPEDALRFYALRLREVGMINSTPQQIIAEGTDWRFLNELRRELKA
jgi:NitT/TauT family transport system substrate-binding protein